MLDVGMVYTNYQVIDEIGKVRGIGSRCQIPYSKEQLLVDLMTFHFRLMRRSTYEQVGGIDSSFQWADDYDLCLKISEVTQIHHLPRLLYLYRCHSDNMTNSLEKKLAIEVGTLQTTYPEAEIQLWLVW